VHITVVDDSTAAALAEYLGERDYAVYRDGSTGLDVSPLGSINADLLIAHLADHLKAWLARSPGTALRFEP
jgi:hypothetical protein